MTDTSKAIQDLSPGEKRTLLAQLMQQGVSQPRTFPLSFAQERLWFLAEMAPDVAHYNISTAIRFNAPLNISALGEALNAIVQRHESLRTTFATPDGQPVQVVAPRLSLQLPVVDLQQLPEHEHEVKVSQLATEEAHRSFDLSQGPLIRAKLLQLGQQEYVFLLTMHHIISDGWSMTVFASELSTSYAAFCSGQPPALPELPIQYSDFSIWQRQWLTGSVLEKQLTYWKGQLAGLPTLRLPSDRTCSTAPTYRGSLEPVNVPKELTAALKALSQKEGVTLFMTLLAAFKTLLSRYTGQEDIAVGSPIAGRNRREIEGLIGFFVNSLVMRTDLSGDPSFLEALRRVRETALGAYAHQDLPFEKLVEELQPERDLRRNPLFQVMFQLFSISSTSSTNEKPEVSVRPVKTEVRTSNMDLGLDLFEAGGSLSGAFYYSSDLFDSATIARMNENFRVLLEGIVNNPQCRLSQLPLLNEEQRHQILVDFNATDASPGNFCCLHELFEAQAQRSPDAIAVVAQEEAITYAELNRSANGIAVLLRQRGVRPESLVGLCVERSPEMVAGLLGILKAGGAVVPLDPAYPPERLAFMLRDSRVRLVVTQSRLVAKLDSSQEHQVLCLDEDSFRSVSSDYDLNAASGVTPENAAYVVYTSGSTGAPKGVIVHHRGVCNHLLWQQTVLPLTSSDRLPQKYSLGFDVAISEIFAPLLAGARLVLARPAEHLDPAYLLRLMADEGITAIDLVPSLLQLLLEEGLQGCSSLRRVVCGGEALSIELQDRFRSISAAELFNLYGPAEASIGSTFWTCGPTVGREVVPIGRPIANTTLYIVDRHLNPVPVGVSGELCLGGVGVTRGYLNRSALTAEQFVPDPFCADPGSRLYRTGDLARFMPDGNVEFLGRLDDQVKVRGYRIELGEIEAQLKKHPRVRDAIVVLRQDGARREEVAPPGSVDGSKATILSDRLLSLHPLELDRILAEFRVPGEDRPAGLELRKWTESLGQDRRRQLATRLNGRGTRTVDSKADDVLVAYVMGDLQQIPGERELRRFVQVSLPAYMVPSSITVLKTFPLSPNGKVDRLALPPPEGSRLASISSFAPPATAVERAVANAWQQVLGRKKIGLYDNFFELGGHSLLLVRLRSKLQEQLKVELSVMDLFQYPTIHLLAEHLTRSQHPSLLLQETENRAEKQKNAMIRLKQKNQSRG